MDKSNGSRRSSAIVWGWITVIVIMIAVLALPLYAGLNLGYTESKGPFKNTAQAVDLEGDGDLDVLISHTRWEENDISWAGIGRWFNQGNGSFRLERGPDKYEHFAGFAAGAGDVDQDGDQDIFVQGVWGHMLANQGGMQGGEEGTFMSSGRVDNPPPPYNQGYVDMGGTVTMGDLNGDGRIDVFIASCCYGLNPRERGYEYPSSPSVSWVWINDGRDKYYQNGHNIPMDTLDGRPIRQAALGDIDGDGALDIFAAVGKPTMGTIDSIDDLILLNDGTGRLAIYDQPLGNADSTSVALGDVNGDGRLDALVGTNKGANLWINQGGSGSNRPIFVLNQQSFKAVQTVSGRLQAWLSAAADRLFGLYLPYGSTRTKAVFLADLDGDEDQDAVLARLWGAEIWWNDGRGEFRRSDQRFEYIEDTGVAVADFDGDGDLDIFTGRNENDYRLWPNDGKGGFSTP